MQYQSSTPDSVLALIPLALAYADPQSRPLKDLSFDTARGFYVGRLKRGGRNEVCSRETYEWQKSMRIRCGARGAPRCCDGLDCEYVIDADTHRCVVERANMSNPVQPRLEEGLRSGRIVMNETRSL